MTQIRKLFTPLVMAGSYLLFLSCSVLAEPGCSASAGVQRLACEYDLRDDFFTTSAQCLDATNPDAECFDDAEAEFEDGVDECNEVLEARLELCEALGDATHDPAFGPDFAANFVDPLEIGNTVAANPWFPLVTGNHWVYEGGDEVIDVTVTGDTKLIDGITCVVVIDVVTEDETVIEITDDWYAQDVDGNVWYCGEIAENFEEFDGDDTEGPELVDIDGSWKAGRDNAEPGVLLPREPQVGDTFRQEIAQTDAEDAVEILAVDASETAPGASCDSNCLQTRDFTPLEPGVNEHKYYAPGIGMIVELDPDTGERVELTSFEGAGQ